MIMSRMISNRHRHNEAVQRGRGERWARALSKYRAALVGMMAVLTLMTSFASPRPAAAHPMGNFSINQYSELLVGPDRVDVLYVVDMAEIPTFQELGTIRPDHSTDLSPQQRQGYIARKTGELVKGLQLSINGQPLQLLLGSASLSFPPGSGGLPTLRLEMKLWTGTSLPHNPQTGPVTLDYTDSNLTDRIGWKEIVARPVSGVSFEHSSVPTTGLSERLTRYPVDAAVSPPQVLQAQVTYGVGTGSSSGAMSDSGRQSGPTFLGGQLSWAQQRGDALTRLMEQKELPLAALLVGLVVAFALGAGHALSPGHGKTVVAAYLVGSRGTALHAALLGFTVTASHTVGVFLLGLVVLYASDYILPEALYPWLSFGSGVLVALVGAGLFIQRWWAWRHPRNHTLRAGADRHEHHRHHPHDHDHDHDHGQEHGHEYEHEHDGHHRHAHHHDHQHNHEYTDPAQPHRHGLFGRPHTHVPATADGQKVSMGSLLVLGITGGILPCPSALVVLLVAIASHRVALGLLLIVAFSLGLASVLTGIGLLMVYGRNLFGRINLSRGLMARLPMASALVVCALGVLIAVQAVNLR
jgi:ABC-type nickel/cobalt efflux system permease component RcnA